MVFNECFIYSFINGQVRLFIVLSEFIYGIYFDDALDCYFLGYKVVLFILFSSVDMDIFLKLKTLNCFVLEAILVCKPTRLSFSISFKVKWQISLLMTLIFLNYNSWLSWWNLFLV